MDFNFNFKVKDEFSRKVPDGLFSQQEQFDWMLRSFNRIKNEITKIDESIYKYASRGSYIQWHYKDGEFEFMTITSEKTREIVSLLTEIRNQLSETANRLMKSMQREKAD